VKSVEKPKDRQVRSRSRSIPVPTIDLDEEEVPASAAETGSPSAASAAIKQGVQQRIKVGVWAKIRLTKCISYFRKCFIFREIKFFVCLVLKRKKNIEQKKVQHKIYTSAKLST